MKMKRFLSMVLTLCMVLSMLPVSTLATEDAPELVDGYYEIYTADQLYWFAKQVNSGKNAINGKLMADIVVNENVLKEDGTLNGDGSNFKHWTPIGNNSNYSREYTGTFDGNGKTVSGLYFKHTSGRVGLFGSVLGGCIQNVGVVDSYFCGYYTIGGVVGDNNYGTISNCYNTGSVSGSGSDSDSGNYVGGVVGYNIGLPEKVQDCYNTGTVSGRYAVGGVVGYNSCTISNCYNTGSVSGSGNCVGGVVGDNYGLQEKVQDCYNTGSVSGSGNYVGGVVGCVNDGDISNCYNTGSVSSGGYVGGVVGDNRSGTVNNCHYLSGCVTYGNSYGRPMTAEQFSSGEITYLLQGDRLTHIWGQKIGTDPLPVFSKDRVYLDGDIYANCPGHSYVNGFCSMCDLAQEAVLNGDVYEISNAGQLYWFMIQVNAGNSNLNAMLMVDITINENVLAADGTLNGDGSTFRVWMPIGDYYSYHDIAEYTGNFDGNGKTVSGLYFNTSESYVGLFGYVGSGGKVHNVGVVDSYFGGSSSVGGVVGSNGGTVSNSYNTGSVSGSGNYIGGVAGYNTRTVSGCYNTGAVSGSNYVGGVVGYNDDSCTVSGCYNTGSISGSWYVGGVVGYNFTYIFYAVNNSYNTGTVSGSIYVGGVVGYNIRGTVSNSYNTGSVSGNESVGGVTGYNSYSSTVSNSYNTGAVSGSEDVGGVVGYNKGTVTSCYYRTDCVSDTNGKGTPMTAGQFASGEVAYLLQLDQEEHIWGQKIGVEKFPGFSEDEVFCITDEQGNVLGYSNVEGELPVLGVTVSGNVTSYLEGDVTVELVQNGEVVYSVTVDGAEYTIEGVVAGNYTLRVTKANHIPQEYAITVGQEPLVQDATICPVGDVTGDGNVNIKDFQRLLRHVNKTIPLEGYALNCGDVTGDGTCNIKDFQRLLRHVNKTNPLF